MPATLELQARRRSAAKRPPPPRNHAQSSADIQRPALERDHLLVIHDASWGMYLDLDSKFGGTRTRLTYHKRRIDIMTLSADHERIKGNLHDFIVAHCQDEEIEYVSEGGATLRIEFEQGKEPDDSFFFGIESKQRPDMVLEVVLTSAALNKLDFYAPLKIPEVWVWDSSGLAVFILEGSRYRKAKRSRLLPKFDVALAGSLATAGRTSQAVREFRKRS